MGMPEEYGKKLQPDPAPVKEEVMKIKDILAEWCMGDDAHMLLYPQVIDDRNVSADKKQSGLYRASSLLKHLENNGLEIVRKQQPCTCERCTTNTDPAPVKEE